MTGQGADPFRPHGGDLVRYRGFIADSRRWSEFRLREGDIVITTPPKAGTTWMQTIVSLLIFDGIPDEPVNELSPWLDMNLRSTEEVFERLQRQTHRRFIKTHVPLDGLPWHPGVTYLTVGRDPRDAFVSMLSHLDNMHQERVLAVRVAAVGDDDLPDIPQRWPDSDDPRELISTFLGLPRHESHSDVNLENVVDHLRQAWETRHLDNCVLFHYSDLSADLEGEMCKLRDLLGVDLTDRRVGDLSALASLSSMRSRADTVVPDAELSAWQDTRSFLRAGQHGEGVSTMTAEERQRYDDRCDELFADPTFRAWVHGGWKAVTVDGGPGV